MPAPRDGRPVPNGPTFSVERFDWGAPDRLVVAGTFSGLAEDPPGEAVLTVIGDDGPHRLPAVEQGPADGDGWTAQFAWLEPPVAFDRARLELGGALSVELPADAEGPLPVVRADDEAASAPRVPRPADPDDAAGRLRLETRLLEEAEELEQARASARQAEEALARAEADLDAERERRSADAERFREGLAMVRGSAEQAVAAAASARAEAEAQARAEVGALQERLAALEPAGDELESTRTELRDARAELEDSRGELERAREELEAVRGELDAARDALATARESAQELLDRLSDHATGRR